VHRGAITKMGAVVQPKTIPSPACASQKRSYTKAPVQRWRHQDAPASVIRGYSRFADEIWGQEKPQIRFVAAIFLLTRYRKAIIMGTVV
jgi:hypothetical protein